MPDPSYEVLPKRGRCLLLYSDDKDKDRRSSKKNVLMYLGFHALWLMIPIKSTFCKQNWAKTVNRALSSDLYFFPPPRWGCHHQLDDHHRNRNINDRDHLDGQLTRVLVAVDPRLQSYGTQCRSFSCIAAVCCY